VVEEEADHLIIPVRDDNEPERVISASTTA